MSKVIERPKIFLHKHEGCADYENLTCHKVCIIHEVCVHHENRHTSDKNRASHESHE